MDKLGKSFAALLFYLLVSFVLSLLLAGMAYFGLEFANSFDSRIPTFPYWALYWLIFTIRIILPSGNGSTSSD